MFSLKKIIIHFQFWIITFGFILLNKQILIKSKMDIGQLVQYLTKNQNDQNAEQLLQQLKKGSPNNRIYSDDQNDQVKGFMLTFYTKPLMYAGQPYYCPTGWTRYSLDVGLSRQQFAKKYHDWPVCYHGTSSSAAFSIISNGFKAFNNQACWIAKNQKAVYFTPSIKYASHPRYAKIQQYNGMYIQLVLQIRLRKDLFVKKPGTLKNAFPDCKQDVDQNYTNKQLQWVVRWNKNKNIRQKDGIVIYGIMTKISKINPLKVEKNQWYHMERITVKQ